jgi:hypothetical protein
MTDTPQRGYDVQPPAETPAISFHSIFNKVHHAANVVVDKVHQVSTDPDVREHVQAGTRVVGNIGVGVVNGVKQDGVGMANDVRSGNYAGAALRAAPLLVGGPAGLVVKEVAPKVISESVKQLPPGARHQVESTGVGRTAMTMVEHGRIPTSPAGIAQVALEGTKRNILNETITNLTGGRVNGGDVQAANTVRHGGNLPVTTWLREAQSVTANQRPQGQISPWQSHSQAASVVTREVARPAVNAQVSLTPLVGNHARMAATPASYDRAPASANVPAVSNPVFPSWMKPAVPKQ